MFGFTAEVQLPGNGLVKSIKPDAWKCWSAGQHKRILCDVNLVYFSMVETTFVNFQVEEVLKGKNKEGQNTDDDMVQTLIKGAKIRLNWTAFFCFSWLALPEQISTKWSNRLRCNRPLPRCWTARVWRMPTTRAKYGCCWFLTNCVKNHFRKRKNHIPPECLVVL